ncbi:metallophosphoesterase family protein [Thermospira aquatica]|uniref:Metallophosphoesterase n=1 Tax=Thermospira aquatica TaxID=2828656 RepID=A0AAX3BAD0_9SPIR|nr:metallophosphoesterase [Thermospira aquatica]URA09190.1 metallophosphoesterase [Thermospira aquatica]
MKSFMRIFLSIFLMQTLYGQTSLSWVVVSDLHYYSSELGTNGKAFESYLADDRKLLREAPQLLEAWIQEVMQLNVDFILIPGDLTKDGELVNHEAVRSALQKIKKNHPRQPKIFVIPGNHDLNNPEAFRYEEDKTLPVAYLSDKDFAEFYADFGYRDAFSRDTFSLSYAVRITPDFWLAALDSTINESNRMLKHPVTEGRLKPQTLKWLEGIAQEAKKSNATLILMMHHGLFEHWPGQRKLHPEYLLNNRKDLAKLMAKYRIRLVFTGHYHSQDITASVVDKETLYDIETGSLVSYPSPYRICSLEDAFLTIQTSTVSIYPGFEEYSRQYLIKGLTGQALNTIRKYGVPDAEGVKIAEDVAKGFAVHYAGDEPGVTFSPTGKEMGARARFILWYQGYVIRGLQTDLLPPDKNLRIHLPTGAWSNL